MASIDNPEYTVYLIDGKRQYNITPAVEQVELESEEKQIAQVATITCKNEETDTGDTICEIVQARQRILIYADDGTKKDEVFRGWIWTERHDSDLETTTLQLKCYDQLIYLQQSEDSLYFSKGTKTETVMTKICKNWGVKLKYSYSSISHPKLVLRGDLSNIITSDVLEEARKKTGRKYFIYSKKDVMYVTGEAENTTVYNIKAGENAIQVKFVHSLEDMVTKVKILGSASGKSGKVPVKAVVTGDTKKYGTLQKLQNKDKDTSLASAKKEANNTIKEQGKPTKEYQVKAPDIPWIVKGDKVHVKAGHIRDKDLIVIGVEHTISNKERTMTLTLREPRKTSTKLTVDGKLGSKTIKALQKWLGAKQDGKMGEKTIKALQKKLGVKQDGKMGAKTIKALQRYLNKQISAKLKVDGKMGSKTIKALQKFLNKK